MLARTSRAPYHVNGCNVIAAEVVAAHMALWFATVRCTRKEFPFWEGVALVARYMRTEWLWTDVLAGGLGISCLLIAFDCIALTPSFRRSITGCFTSSAGAALSNRPTELMSSGTSSSATFP